MIRLSSLLLLLSSSACVPQWKTRNAESLAHVPDVWLTEVADPGSVAVVSHAVPELAFGRPNCARHYAPSLNVGPALWRWLVRREPRIARLGRHVVLTVHASPAVGNLDWEMRSLRSTKDVCLMLSQPPFQSVATFFVKGRVRPARGNERRTFLRIVPVELQLQRKPLVVIERGDSRLVALVDGGVITWVDLLSGWYVDPEVMVKDGELDTTWIQVGPPSQKPDPTRPVRRPEPILPSF